MKAADSVERRTSEYLEMLRQLRAGASGAPGPAALKLTTGADPLEQAALPRGAGVGWPPREAPGRRQPKRVRQRRGLRWNPRPNC